jgi:F-type H+-transporting ATPase subunit a
MHEIERTVVLLLPTLWGIDLSITNEVLLLWLAAGIAFTVLFLASRAIKLVPHGVLQNGVEAVIEFIDKEVVGDVIGPQGVRWSSFVLTLFFFILFSNLVGLIPIPSHFKAATGNINVTAALAVMVLLVTMGINIAHNGVWGFLKRFAPSGVPKMILPMIVPIEIVSWLARPFSLAVRLFANILAGHTLLLVFIGLAASLSVYLKPLPFLGGVIMEAFELFVCFIQAFVFTILTALYIQDALAHEH